MNNKGELMIFVPQTVVSRINYCAYGKSEKQEG